MQNILIIGAHYDDAELGAGGTAAKLASEGHEVYKLTLTDNVTRFAHMNIQVEYETSLRQSSAACAALGVTEILDFQPIECSHLVYDTEVMQRIENILYQKNIDTVFMHYVHDMNQDHIAAAKLCMTASRHCKNVFMYQSNLYVLEQPFYPNYFFDISDYIHLKIQALEQYGEEHNRFNRLFQTNVERNHVWGYANGVEYAEGFSIVRRIED
jgi:LmbE family N-acetylglucosaminyl deacetylase